MDYLMGTITLSGLNFAPVGWAYCQGQDMSIQQNQALYSLLGVQFGGNGTTTFKLPNLTGKAPIGTGVDPVLGNLQNGQAIGNATTTLNQNQLPAHIHSVAEKTAGQTVNFGTATAASTATTTVKASDAQAGLPKPTSNYWAKPWNGTAATLGYNNTNNVTMASDAVAVNVATTVSMSGQSFNAGNLQTGPAGASQAFSLMQPSMAISYIICTQGLYPQRP